MGDGQERTETATGKHRHEARIKGTVAKSQDLTHALVLIALILVLPGAAASLGTGGLESVSSSFASIPSYLNLANLTAYVINSFRPYVGGILTIMATAMLVGVASNFAQVGFTIASQALKPSFSKLNPVSGIKRLLSPNSIFETFKALFKLTLFALTIYSGLHGSWSGLLALDQLAPGAAMAFMGGLVKSIAIRIAVAWLFLAGIDYFFQRYQIDKSLRMTKEEVKREMKEMEMSPQIKAARNARRRKLMRQRLKEAVASADVVVTNPTHYAVALKYEPGKSFAPVVVAKGVDYLAAKIREQAAESEIPLVPNPPLARALYKQCEVGDFVPRELFQAVAEVLAYVYRTLNKLPGGLRK